ncbi:hypothetical protein ACTMSW_00505 [Micromonospora sp. BQ11]|uniref:hypothetical protein n=1 Tax=Micromonospora sp. BQ11 TaxID=3452212 RepID=UPI003F895BE3
MSRDELEQALRETLARQVAVPPRLTADPAGVAIRRAARSQRRRTLAGVALAAVTTVAVSTGMAQLGREPRMPNGTVVVLGDPYASSLPPAPQQVAPPGPAVDLPVGVDLVVGDVLATADGRRLTLAGLRPVDRVQRTRDSVGWLVVGGPTAAGRSLWSVRPSGPPQVLLSGADEIVLSGDGRHVAWREGTQLGKGAILNNKVIAVVRRAAPDAAFPVGFAGDRVLIRLHPERPGHALWHPPTGQVSVGRDRTTTHIHGTGPTGVVVAQISAGTPRRPCLALLDPARDLAPTRTTCGPALTGDGRGGVSPDGRWLLVNGRDTALLVDLAATTPTARPAGPPVAGEVAWTSDTALHATADGLLVQVEAAAVVAGREVSSNPVAGLAPGARVLPVTDAGS